MKKKVVMATMLVVAMANAALAADNVAIDFSSRGKMEAAIADYQALIDAETSAEAAKRATRAVEIATIYSQAGKREKASEFMNRAKQFAGIAGVQIPSNSRLEQDIANKGSQTAKSVANQ